jgi:hypothetical protein
MLANGAEEDTSACMRATGGAPACGVSPGTGVSVRICRHEHLGQFGGSASAWATAVSKATTTRQPPPGAPIPARWPSNAYFFSQTREFHAKPLLSHKRPESVVTGLGQYHGNLESRWCQAPSAALEPCSRVEHCPGRRPLPQKTAAPETPFPWPLAVRSTVSRVRALLMSRALHGEKTIDREARGSLVRRSGLASTAGSGFLLSE